MRDEQGLSALIGTVYDAALDPSLWTDVLPGATSFVGGCAAALFAKSAAGKTGGIFYDYGTDPHFRDLYFSEYIKLDPSTTGQFFAEIDEPIATADFIPYDEFLETRFYQEWARPQHLVDFVSAVLDKSVTTAAMFGVFRHERDGVVDDQARRRMRLIIPHIRRAVLISRLIDVKAAESAMLSDLLEAISTGMFLVDGSARIVHANTAGHVMLDAGVILRAVGGRLVATAAEVDASLHDVFAAAADGDAAIGIKGIAVPLSPRASEPYVAHILPLTSGERRHTGSTYAAVAALFVRKAALEAPSPPEVIAKSYALTPTELRVLLAIVEVGGVPEVAVALGVAETTVKTHLSRLYAKTNTGRQADLVKLVAGFSSPLAN
jgi:DNA-binding CsgD family transcriptional regulator/PAS domain-containing protein